MADRGDDLALTGHVCQNWPNADRSKGYAKQDQPGQSTRAAFSLGVHTMAIRLHKYSHATHTHQSAHTSLKRRVDTFIYRVPLYHLSNNLCPESL